MQIGIVSGAYARYGAERYQRMRADGYTACDFGLSNTDGKPYTLSDEDFDAWASEEKRLADEAGVTISQVHGPWRHPPQDYTPEDRAERQEKMRRCIRATRLLGSRYFVIHPIMPFGTTQDPEPERLFEMNREFFRELLPVAWENDVIICLENMPFKCLSLSTPAQILQFVQAMDDPHFAICLDTGHSMVFGIQPGDAMRLMGSYVKVLHVHDNDGERDLHRAPFTGVVDWADFSAALREVGYNGVLSLETTPSRELDDGDYTTACKKLAADARRL